MKQTKLDNIEVYIGQTADEAAERSASDFAAAVKALLAQQEEVNVILAGAQSQQAFHKALVARKDIDWHCINALGVDDFHAPNIPMELSVCAQPQRDLYQYVKVKTIHIPNYAATDPQAERARYENVLRKYPPDIACMGIGQSGHIAFNEPGCDFDDKLAVRVIDVCEESRKQLTSDPNFCDLDNIPSRGITATIPVLRNAKYTFVNVPYVNKAPIVKALFDAKEITNEQPMTLFRDWPNVSLYLDAQSASLLDA